jgi:hypothetical protein
MWNLLTFFLNFISRCLNTSCKRSLKVSSFFSGKNLLKKWTYMRDNWMRSYRKQNDEKKSGAGANSSRKYICYEQMLFLKKVAQHKDTVSSLSENTDETNEAIDECTGDISWRNIRSQIDSSEFSRPAARKRKNRQPDEVEARVLEILEKTDTSKPNRHVIFSGYPAFVAKFK